MGLSENVSALATRISTEVKLLRAAMIPNSIVDAKGDLLAATGIDTVARLPVGATTGHVLTVDPASSVGISWLAPTGGAAIVGGTIPSARVALPTPSSLQMGASGMGGTYEDIPGLAVNVTSGSDVPLWAIANVALSTVSGNSAVEIGLRVVINSPTETVGNASRVIVPRAAELNATSASVLSAALPAGTYTARVQWRLVSGSSTPEITTGSVFIQAQQAPQGPKGDPGTPGTTPTNAVTTDTVQTISAAKTFSVAPVVPDSSFSVAKLSATGAASATTYLRGDGTWSPVASGGGGTSIPVQTEPDPTWATGTIWFDPDDSPVNATYAIEVYPFFQTGALTVKPGAARVYLEANYVVESIRASLGSASVGASVIADVNLNGTSLFTTQANRPTIPAGGFTALSGAAGQSITVGQYLTVDVDQIGSTTPGSDLSVVIRLRRV